MEVEVGSILILIFYDMYVISWYQGKMRFPLLSWLLSALTFFMLIKDVSVKICYFCQTLILSMVVFILLLFVFTLHISEKMFSS